MAKNIFNNKEYSKKMRSSMSKSKKVGKNVRKSTKKTSTTFSVPIVDEEFAPPSSKEASCTPPQEIECPVQLTLELLGGRWKLAIIHSLYKSTKRFKELERDLAGVTPKILTKQLKDLEINALVNREYFATIPPTVEYSLTDYGQTIVPLVLEIKKWGLQHQKRMNKAVAKKNQ
jgi:DNA-binding HxlR family transcriptional regulator